MRKLLIRGEEDRKANQAQGGPTATAGSKAGDDDGKVCVSSYNLLKQKWDANLDSPTQQSATPRSFSCGPVSLENSSQAAVLRDDSPDMNMVPEPEEPPDNDLNPIPFTLPPQDIVVECVDLYLKYCHKQPLWLFDEDDFLQPDLCSREVFFGILALAARYSDNPFFTGRVQEMCAEYAESARGLVMLQIAQGSVQLSTIQSLCLLALANFIGKSRSIFAER